MFNEYNIENKLQLSLIATTVIYYEVKIAIFFSMLNVSASEQDNFQKSILKVIFEKNSCLHS